MDEVQGYHIADAYPEAREVQEQGTEDHKTTALFSTKPQSSSTSESSATTGAS